MMNAFYILQERLKRFMIEYSMGRKPGGPTDDNEFRQVDS